MVLIICGPGMLGDMSPAHLGYRLLGIATVAVIAAAADAAVVSVKGGWLACVAVALITGVPGFGLIVIDRRGKLRDRSS